jgi:hypothetical protein
MRESKGPRIAGGNVQELKGPIITGKSPHEGQSNNLGYEFLL